MRRTEQREPEKFLTFCHFSRETMPRSLSRQFSTEVHSRAIDACTDVEELRRVAKTLLSAWQLQAEMSERYGAELLGIKRA